MDYYISQRNKSGYGYVNYKYTKCNYGSKCKHVNNITRCPFWHDGDPKWLLEYTGAYESEIINIDINTTDSYSSKIKTIKVSDIDANIRSEHLIDDDMNSEINTSEINTING